jgi:hypothetical protein
MRTGRIKLRSCKDTKCYMHCKCNWNSAYILFNSQSVSRHIQIAVQSERRHVTRRPSRISERKSPDIYRGRNGRYRAAGKYKTHSKRQTFSQSYDLKDTQNKTEHTRYLPFSVLFTYTLHLNGMHPTRASELQYTTITAVVYRSNTGTVGPDHIQGVDVHLHLICLCIALCSYRHCGRPIPSPGKHSKCIEI